MPVNSGIFKVWHLALEIQNSPKLWLTHPICRQLQKNILPSRILNNSALSLRLSDPGQQPIEDC